MLFYIIVLLLGLLCSIWSILFLGYVLLGYRVLLWVRLRFILVGWLCLLLFRIVLGWLGRIVLLEILIYLLVWWIGLQWIWLGTPPSLLGIDRRIVYVNRKYHSGWMYKKYKAKSRTLHFPRSCCEQHHSELYWLSVFAVPGKSYAKFNFI